MSEPEIPEHLKSLAEIALSESRRLMEKDGSLTMTVIATLPSGKNSVLSIPNECGDLLNSSEAKKILFDLIRAAVQKSKATAVAIISDTWFLATTKKMLDDNPGKSVLELKNTLNFLDVEPLLAKGWVTRTEAISVQVQTEQSVLMIVQPYHKEGNRIVWDQRQQRCSPQSDFSGAQKMYGVHQSQAGHTIM